MELKFIWISDYKNIKKVGFNFQNSDNQVFEYSSRGLTIQKKEEPPLDFGNNIDSITAIAGENGSGKSSLIEIIIEALATRCNGGFTFNEIFIGLVCYGNYVFYSEMGLLINKDELEKQGFKVISFSKSPLENTRIELESKTGFFFYSNNIDWRGAQRTCGLSNISTFGMLTNDFERISSIRPGNNEKGSDILLSFIKDEYYRVVNFYLHHHSDISYLNPQFIYLEPKCSDSESYLVLDGKLNKWVNLLSEIEDGILNFVWGFISVSRDDLSQRLILDENVLRENTKKLYRINLIKRLSENYFEIFNSFEEPIIRLLIERSDWSNIIPDSLQKFTMDSSRLVGLEKGQELQELLRLHELIVNISTYWQNKLSTLALAGNQREWRQKAYDHKVECSAENKIMLRRLLELEYSLTNSNGYSLRLNNYTFNFQPSSGEWSMLVLYGRLWEELSRLKSDTDLFENYILLLDEPEINMHPNWKRRFLNDFLYFLTNEFPKNKFQVILSTHSPYLLSDLPNENVLLMKRNAYGNSEVVENGLVKSFGANIHELLANSFFMKEGTIGEFSKRKINSLFTFLHDNEESNDEWDFDKAWSIIKIVGDNNVKQYLIELYNKKVSRKKGPDAFDLQVERMEEEILQLKQIKKMRKDEEGGSDDKN